MRQAQKYSIFILALLLASCSTSRQIAKAKQTLNDNPPAGAEYCAIYFPARDSITVILGDTTVVSDTVWSVPSGGGMTWTPGDSLRTGPVEVYPKVPITIGAWGSPYLGPPQGEFVMSYTGDSSFRFIRHDSIQPPRFITRTITNTRTIHDTIRIVRVDRAAVTACESQLAESNDRGLQLSRENDALKARIRGKVLIPWWLVVLAGLGLGGWIWWRVKAGALRSVISKMK